VSRTKSYSQESRTPHGLFGKKLSEKGSEEIGFQKLLLPLQGQNEGYSLKILISNFGHPMNNMSQELKENLFFLKKYNPRAEKG